jgi:hypothetical protein
VDLKPRHDIRIALFGYPCKNHSNGIQVYPQPLYIPEEIPTRPPLANNHPLFTTVSGDALHSLHPARFLPFIVGIPQIHAPPAAGRSKILSQLCGTFIPSHSYRTEPRLSKNPTRNESSPREGGFCCWILVWYIELWQSLHESNTYCSVQKM